MPVLRVPPYAIVSSIMVIRSFWFLRDDGNSGGIMNRQQRVTLNRRRFVQLAGLASLSLIAGGCSDSQNDAQRLVSGQDAQAVDQTFRAFDHARTLEEIRVSGEIVVGISSDAAPYGYLNEMGNYAGLEAELASLVGWDVGASVRYVQTDPSDVGPYLQAHKIDAAFCFTSLPGNDVLVSFPFIETRQALVTSDAALMRLDEVGGMSIAVCAGTYAEALVVEELSGAHAASFSSYTNTFAALREGLVASACVDQFIARAWVRNNGGYSVTLDDLGDAHPAGIMVSSENDELLGHMNHEVFAQVNGGAVRKLYEKLVAPVLSGADYSQSLLPVASDE